MASIILGSILHTSQSLVLYNGYATFVLGIIGNSLIVLAFTNLKTFKRNQCAFYFISESTANIFQLMSFLVNSVLKTIYTNEPVDSILVWCKLRSMWIVSCKIIAFSEILFSACDQYLSTSHQIYLRNLSTIKLAKVLTFIAIGLAISQMMLFAIYLEIANSICAVFNINVAHYLSYFYYPVLIGVLPIYLASLFSILAYRNVRKIVRQQIRTVRRKRDRQLTAMVLTRVILFVILTLPYTIHRTYTYVMGFNQSNLFLHTINPFIGDIAFIIFDWNFSISFYAFIITSVRFRHQVKHVLLKKYWRKIKRWCHTNDNHIHPNTNTHSTDSGFELE